MKRLLFLFLCSMMLLLPMPQTSAKDCWVYSDDNVHVYCKSESLQMDSDRLYYEVSAKTVAVDGTYLGRQNWRFYNRNGAWEFWHSGMDETNQLYTSRQDYEVRVGRNVFDWCRRQK